MSRWLHRSGERSPTRPQGAGALKTPPREGRRGTEETVDGDTSRRSSEQSHAGDVVEGAGSTNADPDLDWEVIHHTNALEGSCAGAAIERPLSPGVDFTKGVVGEPETEPPDGKGRCKWEDAANTHSFLVRGPTYLHVSLSFAVDLKFRKDLGNLDYMCYPETCVFFCHLLSNSGPLATVSANPFMCPTCSCRAWFCMLHRLLETEASVGWLQLPGCCCETRQ